MKKKIINGILMAAMLFAGTTSFVSCKDNVDDVTTSIYKDLDKVKNDLQLQIDALDSRLTSLEGRVGTLETKVSALEAEVAQIKKDIEALTTRVKNLEEEQAKLQARMDAAEKKITELEDYVKSAIYDVKIEETNDAVLGTINLPFLQVPTMMCYYGLNASGIQQFPTKSDELHVYSNDGADEALVNGQYASQIEAFGKGVSPIKFEGAGEMIAQYTNNTGTIYFSVNPVGVDLTGVTFDFIDSKGNVYPYEISDVKGSDHWLAIGAGKTGYGRDEADETDNVNLYEAKVNLPMSKWDKAISYNLDDTWKTLGNLNEIGTMINKVKEAKSEGGKTEASKVLIKEALQWIQNQYQKTYNDKLKMKYQALRATGKVNVAKSSTHLVVAAVEPFSYKTFWELDQNGKDAIKANLSDAEAVEKAVAELIKITGKKASEIKGGITADTSYSVTISGQTITSGQMAAGMLKAIINNIPYANNVLEKLKNVYHAAEDGDTDAVVAKVSNFLSKVSAKIATVAGDNYFYNCVTPIVLFEGPEGIDRLVPGATLDIENNRMTVILTSPTEEYLVPAMYKYIAVRQGEKIYDAKILSGQEKVAALNLRQGECEIIYQTVDYSGYVVTKSYPVTVK
jgi:TolA-binding protein